MKVQREGRREVYLITIVEVSDGIESFANVANRQENVLWSKMIKDAIDQFDG